VEKMSLKDLPRPKTEVMINLGNPEEAFSVSMIPNDGVGLARWGSSSTATSGSPYG
jgi:pyruvate,water dikinase